MEVGLDPQSQACTELGIPKGVGCCSLGLHVATIRPEAHQDLAHPEWPNAQTFVQDNGLNCVHSMLGGIRGQAIAQPINPICHCLLEPLRMCTVATKPVLKHLGFNAARPGAARETCRCLCNTIFIAIHRHGVQQVVGIAFNSTTQSGCLSQSTLMTGRLDLESRLFGR